MDDSREETPKADTLRSKRNPHDIIGIPGIICAHNKDLEL